MNWSVPRERRPVSSPSDSRYSPICLQTPRYVVTGSKVDTKSAPLTLLRMPKVGLVAAPKVIVVLVPSP